MRSPRRSWLTDIALLLIAAGALRVALFSGYCLGDDPAYSSLVRKILDGSYPATSEPAVFVGRPVFLGALSLGVAVGGWSEWAIVSPVLLASLVGIGAAYYLARAAGGRTAGWATGILLASLPLDVVHSTTLTNDIFGTSLCVLGLAFTQLEWRRARRTLGPLSAVGGFLVGLAAGVKLTFILAGPLMLTGAFLTAGAKQAVETKRLRNFAVGWGLAIVAGGVFFARFDAGPLFPVRAELHFNQRYMGQVPGVRELLELLSFYPQLLLGSRLFGPVGARWSIYGATILAFFFGVLFGQQRGGAWRNTLMAWVVGTALFLEFWPLQLVPTYVPIHRLPRFLHVVLVPMTILAGVGIGGLLRMRGIRRILASLVLAGSAAFNLAESARGASFHRDAMSDLREAWKLAEVFPAGVYSDPELLDYLRFRSGYQDSGRFLELGEASDVPKNSLVIVGGSRRPELDPAVTVGRAPSHIPKGWRLLATLSPNIGPWRPLLGSAYFVAEQRSSDRDPVKGVLEHRLSAIAERICPGGLDDWELLEIIDVGDRSSEKRAAYEIVGETWSGQRRIDLSPGEPFDDRGRAFSVEQSMDIPGVECGARLCIGKLVDTRIWPQRSRWLLNGRQVGVLETKGGPTDFEFFGLVTGEIAGSQQLRLREEVIRTPLDVSSFAVFVLRSRTRPTSAVGSANETRACAAGTRQR